MIWKLFHVLILSILLIGCSKKENEDNKNFKLNLCEEPHTLDPRSARTLRDLTLVKQLFEGLTRLDGDNKPQPALAESIEISDDKLTLTFHLRDSFWNDGTPLTSHDFIYSWKSVLNPKFPTDYAHLLYPIKNGKKAKEGKCSLDEIGLEAASSKTLVVHLENPTPYFLELTSFPSTFPIKNGLDESCHSWMCSAKSFISNGPFSLEKWESNYLLLLSKNEKYWDKDNVFLNHLTLTIISDPSTEMYLFEKGELDWVGQPLSHPLFKDQLTRLKKEGKAHSYPVSGTFWVKFNTENPLFNDQKLRKAFSYAIGREKIIEHILQGNQRIASSLIPPTIATFESDSNDNSKLGLGLFEEFLAEKNLTRENFPPVVLSYFSTDRNNKMAQVIQEMWKQSLGLDVKLDGSENQHFRSKVKQGKYMLAFGDWIADFQDPISFLEIFKYPIEKNGMNDTRWVNEKYSALLEEALHAADNEERKKLLVTAEKIVMDEMPVAPLYYYSFDFAKKDEVKNVLLSHLGIADFKCAYIEKK